MVRRTSQAAQGRAEKTMSARLGWWDPGELDPEFAGTDKTLALAGVVPG